MPKSLFKRHRNVYSSCFRRIRLWHLAAAAAVLLTTALLFWTERLSNAHQSTQEPTFALDEAVTDASFVLDDLVVQRIVEQCMKQQDTFIWVQRTASGDRQVTVWNDVQLHMSSGHVDDSCGLFHIPLASSDRSIGLCTDAALYVQLLGGWIAPATAHGLSHSKNCGHRSAVFFLEPLYESWLTWLDQDQHVIAVYAPNFEQLFAYDKAAHKRMHVVLCKVRRCEQLMTRYLEDIHSTASLIFTGHTSIDPQVLLQPAIKTAATAAASAVKRSQLVNLTSVQGRGTATVQLAAAVQPVSMLHVRGKSGLKHTKQLLDCWAQHPGWPLLTVIGPMPNEQISHADSQRYLAAPNIHVPRPGKRAGPNWPVFDPLPATELAALLTSHAIHIMPSEREGFGHSINEGRAAGAVLLVPDHPPMNELVRAGSGVLLQPRAVFSHADPPVPVLGKYGNISVSMAPEGICGGVSQVLSKTPTELQDMGRKARGLFLSDRAAFIQSMKDVVEDLRSLLQVADASAAAETGQKRGV